MSRTIVIHFPADQGEFVSLVHRLRNFGEDVFRFLRKSEWGKVDLYEIDRATAHFTVRNTSNSKLRRLMKWIETEADRQHLLVQLEVS